MRVLILPPPDLANPYFRRMLEGLETRGISHMPADLLTLTELRRIAGSVEVVHIHWVEFVLYVHIRGARARMSSLLATARLLPALLLCRRFGIRVVWTVHNLAPHESRGMWQYNLAAAVLARRADVVHVHSGEAARLVASRYRPRGKLMVQPQGAYEADYPPATATRKDLRARMAIAPDQFVFLSFGQIRPYKRVLQLIAAIRDHPRDVALVVAGSATDEMAIGLRRAAGNDDRIHLHLGYIEDHHVAGYHVVADAAVLNYDRIVNSGVLLLSLCYSLPAVVPHEGTEELATLPGGEHALERFRPGGLHHALRQMTESDLDRRRRAARQIAQRFTWDAFVDGLVSAYRRP